VTGYAPGTIRVWDGTTWRFAASQWESPTYESIKEGASTGLIATTTTCTKSANVVHAGSAVTLTGSTTGRNGGTLEFYSRIGDAGTWTLLASRAAPTAGGNVSVSHTPTASGTSYYAKFTGSPTHKTSSSPPTPGVTVQTLKSTSKVCPLLWAQAYDNSGHKISGSGHDAAVMQGYYASLRGNRKSLLRFNPALPAGATVSKVILECNNGWAHWYYDSGGTIVVGSFYDQPTKPTTWGAVHTITDRSRKAVDTGWWKIDITSWADGAVENPRFTGITIGPGPSTSRVFDGWSVPAPMGNFNLAIWYSYWS